MAHSRGQADATISAEPWGRGVESGERTEMNPAALVMTVAAMGARKWQRPYVRYQPAELSTVVRPIMCIPSTSLFSRSTTIGLSVCEEHGVKSTV
eukprot:3236260-Prymnesium_polylepis.1